MRICIPKSAYFLAVFLLGSICLHAQLKANFTADVTSGCSPLTVAFTNTTTGASPNAKFQWNMGNGNTSDAQHAQAVYTDAKTYTITLTVKDGSQTDTKSTTIIVYKKPVVNFSADPVKGCAPSEITFTSTSTAGDGTISNYFWDFGDGTTSPGATLQTVKHRYTFAQKPPVKLTVTNSHGCYATAEKTGLVEITPGIRINFSANKTALCELSESVAFSNTTTGPGPLSYLWSFGDGTTSSDPAPAAKVFAKKGTYSVKLKVSNSEGCVDSLVKVDYINAANFTSDFDLPFPLCDQRSLTFTNTSKPLPSQSEWVFSDDNGVGAGNVVNHYYRQSGNFNVKLINTYGACKDEVTKPISISAAPVLRGFVTDKDGACKTPLTVAFEDTSSKAVRWHWNFGTGIAADTSNKQKASFTFNRFGNYYVTLTVTNASGCQSSVSRYINVNRPNVSIGYTSSSSVHGPYGCPGLELKFKGHPEDQIANYLWNFGDGSTSTQAEPKHVFKEEGKYTVKLYYKTTGGCEDSVVAPNYVITYKKPKADFESLSGLTICGNTPVRFKDLTDTATSWYWDFGDGGTSRDRNPVHTYNTGGELTVKLIATNYYCSDTTEKPQFLKVVPPFPDITGISKNCDNRGKITFRQSTQGATKWEWNFGDGSTSAIYTENKEEITHTYTKSGIYKVFLYASDNVCTTYDTTYVAVVLKQNPVLSVDKDVICGSDTVTFKVSGMDTIRYYSEPNKQAYVYPYTGNFYYSDGKFHSSVHSSWYPPEYTQRLTVFRPGTEKIRLVTYDGTNGCFDSSNFVTLKVSGPIAAYKTDKTVYCANAEVTFKDESRGTGNAAIKQWIWNFGDGIIDTLTSGAPIKHKYPGGSNYTPKLRVVDENGCFAEPEQSGFSVSVFGPVAGFYAIDTLVLPNTPVQFFNTTNEYPYYPVNYSWDFGDGTPRSTVKDPAHAYRKSGTYTVKLFAKSTFGCEDSVVRKAYVVVKTVLAKFETTASYVNNNSCPPLLARFTSNSINADSVFWDFGDNSYADNVRTPSHTYYQPGIYKVKLYAFGLDAVDSTEQEVMVNGPFGTITPSALQGCSPTEITLTAHAKNAVSFTWDFNDGYVAQGRDTAAKHVYSKAGVYFPKVILKDASGCTSTFLLEDSIIIDKLNTQFTPSQRLICDSALVTFTGAPVSFSADSLKVPLRYHWQFGTGEPKDTADQQSPSFFFNKLGKYEIVLTTTSVYGCSETITDSVSVKLKPNAEISAAQFACINNKIGFKDIAEHRAGETWLWHYGDGRTSAQENPDSLAFTKPGRYQVALFKNSANGCSDTARHDLIIDELKVKAVLSSKLLCDSGLVEFAPDVSSFALDSLGKPLQYLWNFGTGNAADVSQKEKAVFAYSKPSLNNISLSVSSPYGCKDQYSDSVIVLKTPRGSIQYNSEVCVNSPISIKGSVSEEEHIKWQWDLAGVGFDGKTPPDQTFAGAGKHVIRLIVYNNPACKDTATKEITVNPLPRVALSPEDSSICQGDVLTLKAHDGVDYIWTSTNGTITSRDPSVQDVPKWDTEYKVKVVNEFGCEARDSVRIHVSQPIQINAVPDKDIICANSLLQLRAKGATRYEWIGGVVSNPGISNPVARPDTTTTYTVIGYGEDHCFTDTAYVKVRVIPLPTVNVGRDTVVLWSQNVPLLAQTSADVTQVRWSPASYLNCVSCKNPVSTPQKPVEYQVAVKNSFGCTAVDTIRIALQCAQSTVHIPTAFTPNADGLNDVFYPKGGGVKTIKYLKIYNRWGDLVFERTNFEIDDRRSAWDGTSRGNPLPSETYVYVSEMVCEGNETYLFKGTVNLIR